MTAHNLIAETFGKSNDFLSRPVVITKGCRYRQQGLVVS
jgi:hypothetical protein